MFASYKHPPCAKKYKMNYKTYFVLSNSVKLLQSHQRKITSSRKYGLSPKNQLKINPEIVPDKLIYFELNSVKLGQTEQRFSGIEKSHKPLGCGIFEHL